MILESLPIEVMTRPLKIKDAKHISKSHGYDQVIIIGRRISDDRLEMATYGKTKALCREAARIGDKLFDDAYLEGL